MELAIRLAGVLHLGILAAALHVPFVLDWKHELAKLPPLLRQLVWVHGTFIVIVILSFGVLSLFFAERLASGTPLARAVCAFIAVFWLARLPLEFVIFDVRPHLTRWHLKVGHWLLTLTFAAVGVVFAVAALRGSFMALQ